VVLFDVLPVVALRARQSEQALLDVGVRFVPQAERKAQSHLVVAQAEQPVFAPAVHAGVGMLVREKFPGAAVARIVLTHRAPLTLRQVRSPAVPRHRNAALIRPSFATEDALPARAEQPRALRIDVSRSRHSRK